VSCEPPVPPSPVTGDQSVEFTIPAGPFKPGQDVKIHVKMGQSPATSPATLPSVPFDVKYTLKGSGGSTKADIVLQGDAGTMAIEKDKPVTVPEFDGTLKVPADATGDITLTPTEWITTAMGTKTSCKPTAASPGAIGVVKVDAAGPSVTVTPGTQEPGKEITLGGANWNAGTPKLELCKAAECSESAFSAKEATVGADGKLTGKATIAAAQAEGDYTVKVTVGAQSESAALKVKKAPAAVPTATLDPTSGPVGTEVTVTGSNFPKSAQVFISAVKGDTANPVPAGTPVMVNSDANGAFTGKVKVTDKDTNAIGAATLKDGKPDVQAGDKFTVTGDDPVITDPNGKEVEVTYNCVTTLADGSPSPVPPSDSTLGIKLVLPSAAKAKDKVDIVAEFKDKKLGTAPAITPAGTDVSVTPELTIDVTEGGQKGTAKVGLPEFTVKVGGGDPLTAPSGLKGQFEVWGGGDFSFSPGQLVINSKALGLATVTKCSVKTTSVSATLKASGDKGTPPPPTSTGGGLANTGTGGPGIGAFALIAGTAVLAAVGALLLLPRRRLRARA
jgi:hypothetical protein